MHFGNLKQHQIWQDDWKVLEAINIPRVFFREYSLPVVQTSARHRLQVDMFRACAFKSEKGPTPTPY